MYDVINQQPSSKNNVGAAKTTQYLIRSAQWSMIESVFDSRLSAYYNYVSNRLTFQSCIHAVLSQTGCINASMSCRVHSR